MNFDFKRIEKSDGQLIIANLFSWWQPFILLAFSLIVFRPDSFSELEEVAAYAGKTLLLTTIGIVIRYSVKLNKAISLYSGLFDDTLKELKGKASMLELFKHIDSVDDVKPYDKILSEHIALGHLMPVFSDVLNDIFSQISKNGLVIVQAGNKKYIDILKKSLNTSDDSFDAVLVEPYLPSWFFVDENDVLLTARQKQDYLDVVSKAEGFKKGKKRLLLYRWDRCDEDNGLLKDIIHKTDNVKSFIDLCGEVELWLLDRSKFESIPHGELKSTVGSIDNVDEDFALFDNKLVIKQVKNQGLHVIPVAGKEVARYVSIFEVFEDTKDEYWLKFDHDYVNKCKKEGRLLAGTEINMK